MNTIEILETAVKIQEGIDHFKNLRKIETENIMMLKKLGIDKTKNIHQHYIYSRCIERLEQRYFKCIEPMRLAANANKACEKLINWGFTVDDYNNTDISFQLDDYSVSVEIEDVLYFNKLNTFLKLADFTYYSCCGEILDTDYMICPSCGEHC